MMLRREWNVMDKGDRIFVGGLLSKSLVDVARDGTVFVVVGCLTEVEVVMECREGVG